MKSFLKYWLPVVVWLGLIFIGSTDLLSAEHTSRIIGPILRWFNPGVSIATIARVQFFVRKAAHLGEYLFLAVLLWRAFRHVSRWQKKMSMLFLAVWLICLLFAASDEFHQSFVPSRTASSKDVLIDVIGALVGLTICVAVASQKGLKERSA
jgi:VanZ like family